MLGVFLSYRDGDGAYCALVDQALSSMIGSRNVFRDSKSIVAGEDYAKAIRASLSQCVAMIAIIGPRWLDDGGDRRIDDPRDWVRRELTEAIRREIPIIPVLVDGAGRLTAADLPDDIKPLANKQFRQLRHRHINGDMAELIDGVRKHLPDLILSLDFQSSPDARERVYRAVRQAFGDVDDWEIRGDGDSGAMIRVPASTRPSWIVGVWFERFQEALRNHGGQRVRVGVHVGGADSDLDVARELGRADAAQDLAQAAPTACVVVVVSDHIYQTVVRSGGRKVEPEFYRGVRVADAQAWATVPGWTVPPTVTSPRERDTGSDRGGPVVTVYGDYSRVIQAGRDVNLNHLHNYGKSTL